MAEDIPDDGLIVEDVRLELEEEEQREGLDESYLLDEGEEEDEEDESVPTIYAASLPCSVVPYVYFVMTTICAT